MVCNSSSEGGAGSACGVRQQRVEGERASWQGGLWGWQWVGAAVVAEVGEEVEAVVAREWKQGLARGSGEGGGPVNWTWCCCYLHAALSTGAAELLTSRSSAHLRIIGVGGERCQAEGSLPRFVFRPGQTTRIGISCRDLNDARSSCGPRCPSRRLRGRKPSRMRQVSRQECDFGSPIFSEITAKRCATRVLAYM